MKLSIIIPCYNEGEVLPLTLERFNALSHEWLAREDCTEVEFVLVDDGSQDKTQELLVEASKLEKHFKIIRFSRNFGSIRSNKRAYWGRSEEGKVRER